MEDESPQKKGNQPALSIDRAAFLLLRVKKAFKKKRQQRKDKQAAQQAASLATTTQTRSYRKGAPPPLLRSRTLPAIIVPGISILQAQIDPNQLSVGNLSGFSAFGARLSLQPKSTLVIDDSSLEYRRKSAGSSPHTGVGCYVYNHNEPYIYAFDDVEKHVDGAIVLRIPSPHVVAAARAYQVSGGKSGSVSGTFSTNACFQQQMLSTSGGVHIDNVNSNTALYRLARLLNQSPKNQCSSEKKDDIPRRLSWERREHINSRLPRSASIDSMVAAVWNDSLMPSTSPRPSVEVTKDTPIKLPQQPSSHYQLSINYTSSGVSGGDSQTTTATSTSTSRRESLLSPSAGRRTKQNRGIAEITLPNILRRSPERPNPNRQNKDSQNFTSDLFSNADENTRNVFSSILVPETLKSKQSPIFRRTNSVVNQKIIENFSAAPLARMEFLMPQPPPPRHQSHHRTISSLITSTGVQNGFLSNSGKQKQQQGIGKPTQQQKMTKKQLKLAQAQLDKLTQINIHLHALFSAVEHGHLDKARTILESTDVDVNSLNSDGLSPLDVAVLSNNRSMTKMLLQHGAMDGTEFISADSLGNHLNNLLRDAEDRIQDLSYGNDEVPQVSLSTRASFSSIIGTTGPSVTGCAGAETDKQLGLWERRVKGLRRMLLGWDQARPPDMPSSVTIDVSGLNTVTVSISEPIDGPIGTKFKIQWSSRSDFCNIFGEREISDWTSYQGVMGVTCRISDLTQGRRYFFRSNCGNVKGWGPSRMSVPASVVPSSWRDMDNREPRFAGRQRILDELFTAVRLARPEDASEITLGTPAIQRRNLKKKTTIKQLFSAASKFQKNLRRGIYLACILYYEDKILVTNEDFMPVVEIDETYPSCLHTDYHWLMKVACTWEDLKSLRTDMERNATSAVHFRSKLLSAACQMQSALCADLGQLYHKPLRDSHGTVVLSCVNAVKSPKSISVLNSRWVPINKLKKKVVALHEDNNINEILINSIADQINYHQTSTLRLSKGLYLGYLKMQSSVDQIQVVVPTKTPNVLPHLKVRENSHISAEEWEILRRDKGADIKTLEFRPKTNETTEVQQIFLEALSATAHRLFNYMGISSENALTHRLFDAEVIELSQDVSFLVVCPPAESSCAVPGQREILLQRGDLLSLPIQAFEMIHLRTYQNGIIQKYSRLSCILELDTVLANHSHREAFSTAELQAAKERLAKLQELTSSLNSVWRGVRWLMDVIGFARDRCSTPAVTMKEILEYECSTKHKVSVCNIILAAEDRSDEDHCLHSKRQLLQLPSSIQNGGNKIIKSSPGRGSWPGPAAGGIHLGSNCYLTAEHSKSEQNLGLSSLNSTRYLSANSDIEASTSRKNSADSNYSHSNKSYFSAGEANADLVVARLPPSRSEDTLVVTKRPHQSLAHRKRATTVNSSTRISATSSPHLSVVRSTCQRGTTESLQSLSSDSESASYPLTTSTLNKSRYHYHHHQHRDGSTGAPVVVGGGGVSYLKPTLTALQNEMKLFKEPLAITTESSCGLMKVHHEHNRTIKGSATSTSRRNSDEDEQSSSAGGTSSSGGIFCPSSGIIQVYAAYPTGLASGTSLKLHVTSKTSARDVVDLVIKQLNMAGVLKGNDGPIYAADQFEEFCLVAVIGARERCLRDDFKPLQLQNPWKMGRLYVRRKFDLLAAIEHSNRDTHLI